MKILDVLMSLDPTMGGVQHSVRTLAPIYRRLGHQVDILTFDSPDAPYLEPGMPTYAIGGIGAKTPSRRLPALVQHYGYHPGAIKKLAEIVRGYDAVVVHGLWNFATLAARMTLVRSKVPYFVFAHGMLDPWHRSAYPLKDRIKQVLWRFNEGPLLQHAGATLFTTQVELDLAHRSYLPYRLNPVMVSFGCEGPDDNADEDIAAFHAAWPQLRDRRFLIFLSRIHPKKGCATLLRAFARALPLLGDIDLIMAGPDHLGWRTELEKLAADLGIAGRVHWTGMISGAVKWGAYRAADAFVLPSLGENFGVVVPEAMACGTPVIISDRVNLYHAVQDHGAGLVAPPDLDSTTAALEQFAGMTADQRTAMSRAAIECYSANFKVEAAAQRVLDAIAGICGHESQPALRPAPTDPESTGIESRTMLAVDADEASQTGRKEYR